jgi:hypothetical protein
METEQQTKSKSNVGEKRLKELSYRLKVGDVFNPVGEKVSHVCVVRLKKARCKYISRLCIDIWEDLARASNLPKGAFLSYSTLAQNNGSTDDNARLSVQELKRQGFIIVIEKGKGGRGKHQASNHYAMLWHPIFADQPYTRPPKPPKKTSRKYYDNHNGFSIDINRNSHYNNGSLDTGIDVETHVETPIVSHTKPPLLSTETPIANRLNSHCGEEVTRGNHSGNDQERIPKGFKGSLKEYKECYDVKYVDINATRKDSSFAENKKAKAFEKKTRQAPVKEKMYRLKNPTEEEKDFVWPRSEIVEYAKMAKVKRDNIFWEIYEEVLPEEKTKQTPVKDKEPMYRIDGEILSRSFLEEEARDAGIDIHDIDWDGFEEVKPEGGD